VTASVASFPEGEMKRILRFLATSGSFLYEDHGFRLVDSRYFDGFGGCGWVILTNDALDIRVVAERDPLLQMDFRGKGRTAKKHWFSEDIVRQLLTGEPNRSFLTRANVAFIGKRFQDIERLFSSDRLTETEARANQLERERAKRLFG
jgi:hypothetical protein